MSTVNEIWRIDSDWLMAYTEDRETIRKIKRSYHDFIIVANYYKSGRLAGLQYKIPSKRKRAARYVFGVNVAR
ncbi:hypothetical protein [Heyndrickxia oleronia]|uniref:hypothetical protein n=1 Tax=Heyndrickxia oleronia TaxID=38875 RepID=UPI001B0D1464|nr:hypothetical protein [Heyndrickxia oleronia]GIN39611.1 hypothetical protein J19TS1_25600 [Heyndrickxia oleronia]